MVELISITEENIKDMETLKKGNFVSIKGVGGHVYSKEISCVD